MDMKDRKKSFVLDLKKEIQGMHAKLGKLQKLINKVGKSVLFDGDEVNRAIFVLLMLKFSSLDKSTDDHEKILKALEENKINEMFAELDEKIKDLFDEDDEGIDISKMS